MAEKMQATTRLVFLTLVQVLNNQQAIMNSCQPSPEIHKQFYASNEMIAKLLKAVNA